MESWFQYQHYGVLFNIVVLLERKYVLTVNDFYIIFIHLYFIYLSYKKQHMNGMKHYVVTLCIK